MSENDFTTDPEELQRQVVAVAVNLLFAQYPQDVANVFSVPDLKRILDTSAPLKESRVEDFLRHAYDQLFKGD